MIEKIRKGKGARGLAEYLLAEKDHNGDRRPRHDIIGGTLAGRNPRELAKEIGVLRRLRPNLQIAVGHVSLRVPEGDRPLSDQEWADIGDRWAQEMGMDSYSTVCHGDHIHILFSRINSDGSVVSDSHDYRRGEAAVRKIEREFNLVQVEPSHLLEPENAPAHKTAPKKGDFVAMEKGDTPARLFVQEALDAVLTKQPSATQMVSDLEAVGIIVEPNISDSTGKLSGFAYHFGGYRFTSASLGRGYTMGNMEKKGFTYEPDRDLEAIRAAKGRAASFLAGERAGSDSSGTGHEAGFVRIAGGHSQYDGIQSGTSRPDGGGPGSGAGYAAGDHGSPDPGSGGVDKNADGGLDSRPSAEIGAHGAGSAPESHASIPDSRWLDEGSEGVPSAKSRDAGPNPAVDAAVLDGHVGSGRVVPGGSVDNDGEAPLMAWNSRFKQASARKRDKSQSERQQDVDLGARFQRLRDAARMADLVAYMQASGLQVERDGVKDWVVDDRYRVTKKQDGHFVWCSWDQSRGGDSIAFCIEELGLSLQQALAYLAGVGRLIQAKPRDMSYVARFPSSPPISRDPDQVLRYLEDRGISRSTVRRAQGAGFLRFVDYADTPGVAFCGLDGGQLRSMTVRLVRPIRSWNDETEITKLDIRHSDKSYPAILRGDDPVPSSGKSLWIVEGGMDGLAAAEWYRACRAPVPDIIVSGGAGVRTFLDRGYVREMLDRAGVVYVAMENEKSHKTQEKTDTAHQKQIDKLQALGSNVIAWHPPVSAKDIADAWAAGALPDAHDPLAHMRQQEPKGSSNAAAAARVFPARTSSTPVP